MNDNSHILFAIECHKQDLEELWHGFEIIKTMLNQQFFANDVKWVCETTMSSIDHKINQLNGTKAFWEMPSVENKEVLVNGNKEN